MVALLRGGSVTDHIRNNLLGQGTNSQRLGPGSSACTQQLTASNSIWEDA